MRTFDKAVVWEFKTLIRGEGRNVREAYLDALEKTYPLAQEASDRAMQSVEENELWLVDGKWPDRSSVMRPYTAIEPRTRFPSFVVTIALLLAFTLACGAFLYRYSELNYACRAKGFSAEYCWDLGR